VAANPEGHSAVAAHAEKGVSLVLLVVDNVLPSSLLPVAGVLVQEGGSLAPAKAEHHPSTHSSQDLGEGADAIDEAALSAVKVYQKAVTKTVEYEGRVLSAHGYVSEGYVRSD